MRIILCLFFCVLFMQILASQKMGIGTVTPAAKLDIMGVSSSPSIPGATSTAVLRIAIGPTEALDIGKSTQEPYSAWMQSGFNGNVVDPLSLQPLGGNVGIGTFEPEATLHLVGTLKLMDGMQGAGKVLTSDANGVASWQTLTTSNPPASDLPKVWICCNIWTSQNLNVDTYRNGDPIPKVTDDAQWASLTTGAYCYYNNDSTMYAATYGKLYNWYALNDPRGLAPEGWHLPTRLEWNTLSNCLGGDTIAGGWAKEIGTAHWLSPNEGATNDSGLNAVPAGYRNVGGGFQQITEVAGFWTTTSNSVTNASLAILYHEFAFLGVIIPHKKYGFSVRCVHD